MKAKGQPFRTLLLQVRRSESQVLQSGLSVRYVHEQVPKQFASIVLYHDYDGALVDGQVLVVVPILTQVESDYKTRFFPQLVAQFVGEKL